MNEMEVIEQMAAEDELIRISNKKKFQNLLSYLRSRAFSLNVSLASAQEQQFINIPPQMKTREQLKESFKLLYDDVALFMSVKNCIKLAYNVLRGIEVEKINNVTYRSVLINKVEGILYLSKSVMKLLGECYSEMALVEKQSSYSKDLANYGAHLKQVKEDQIDENSEKAKGLEKAERLLYKINLIRAMKAILIAFLCRTRPEVFPEVKDFQSSFRGNLTLDDFTETWDVGLSSQS